MRENFDETKLHAACVTIILNTAITENMTIDIL